MRLLDKLGNSAYLWLSINPWTNVYGCARTLLALGSAATFAFNDISTLFRPGTGINEVPICGGISQISIFCQFPVEYLAVIKWVVIFILLIIASGWRPRFTGVLHWWISFSFSASSVLINGGEQVTAVLTLILIPITLTDNRRWHWQKRELKPTKMYNYTEVAKHLFALSALLVARIQVAGIYFQAGIAKMSVTEWADGTAIYYWFTHQTFGSPEWIEPFVSLVINHPILVTLLTWGTIATEILLSAGLLLPKKWWRPLLLLGIFFHLGIAFIHGLPSFSFAMWGALIIYFRPSENPFRFKLFVRKIRVYSRFLSNKLEKEFSKI